MLDLARNQSGKTLTSVNLANGLQVPVTVGDGAAPAAPAQPLAQDNGFFHSQHTAQSDF